MKRSVKITSLLVVLMLGSFQHSFAKEESPPDLTKDMMSRLFPKGGKRKYLTGTKSGEKIKHLPTPSSHSALDYYFDWDFSFSARDLVKYLYLIKSSKEWYATKLVLETISPLFVKHWSALEELAENLRDPNPFDEDSFGSKLAMDSLLERYFPLIKKLIQDARALAKEAENLSMDEDPQVTRMLSNALPQDSLESLKVSEEKECE